jgi:uncharacterized spore protein YtfJ
MEPTTGFQDMIESARDVITVRRVYGEPYEKNGLTVIPAAAVRGGGGGGEGRRGDGEAGSGGGFGVMARPTGAWVIEDGEVTWKAAVDVNRVILGGQVVGLVAILVAGRVLYSLSRRGRPRLGVLGVPGRLLQLASVAAAARRRR